MLGRASQAVVGGLEAGFAWYGAKVATHPLKVIAACVLVTGLAAVGVLRCTTDTTTTTTDTNTITTRYTTENNAFKLWIPDNSDFVTNYNWLEENSPPDVRWPPLLLSSSLPPLSSPPLLLSSPGLTP